MFFFQWTSNSLSVKKTFIRYVGHMHKTTITKYTKIDKFQINCWASIDWKLCQEQQIHTETQTHKKCLDSFRWRWFAYHTKVTKVWIRFTKIINKVHLLVGEKSVKMHFYSSNIIWWNTAAFVRFFKDIFKCCFQGCYKKIRRHDIVSMINWTRFE